MKQNILGANEQSQVEWLISDRPVPYERAVSFMQERVESIVKGEESELIWLVEHPPLYSAGTSAKEEDLLSKNKFPIYKSGRGGQYTYHGPGQRVIYVMLDLRKRGRDIRAFVKQLEAWIIDTLASFNIAGETRDGRIGIWVKQPENGENSERKIAAIGVRISRWVSYHGISLNISPDLSHYDGIVPCGINDYGITSFEDLGHLVSMSEVDMVLSKTFNDRFCATFQARK
ncbi:MAG: lipoyl(octanoyl) transferase LipB [Devosiaceae bacterium]|nr:lipoyl(octanoyl) transferase LipB [Devosiaceae bacterium]